MGTVLTNHRADSSRPGLVLAEAPASTFQRSNHSAMKKCSSLLHYLLLLTLPMFATAFAQGPSPLWNPRAARPLKKYDNPPAYIYRLETSPRMVSPYGVFTSYQVNVDASGNNIVGDAANECSISVDPTNTSKMAIGWRQFDSVLSNFRQGGWGDTTDAGVTWTFPGVLNPGVFRSDPVTKSDEAGNFLYLSLRGDDFCDDIWRSTDGGQTVFEQSPDGAGHGGDKQWFTIDTTGGTGHGFLYQFWTEFFACDFGAFNRSLDSGVTWQSPISPSNFTDTGALEVDINGNLFVGGGGS